MVNAYVWTWFSSSHNSSIKYYIHIYIVFYTLHFSHTRTCTHHGYRSLFKTFLFLPCCRVFHYWPIPIDTHLGYFPLFAMINLLDMLIHTHGSKSMGEKFPKTGIARSKDIDICNFYRFTKLLQWHRSCSYLNFNLNSKSLFFHTFANIGVIKL